MASRYQAQQLNRQVSISGRVKTMNESIYYNVDCVHEAINAGRQIVFLYFQWNTEKKHELKHNGKIYEVSPWGLMWDDENYYLVAYDEESDRIKHFRVDKMLKISVSDKKRKGQAKFKELSMPRYTKSVFGMFGGEETCVTLYAKNDMVGVLIDRFGKDIIIRKVDATHFETTVNVRVSNHFLAWAISLGGGVYITSPTEVVDKMRELIEKSSKQYVKR